MEAEDEEQTGAKRVKTDEEEKERNFLLHEEKISPDDFELARLRSLKEY